MPIPIVLGIGAIAGGTAVATYVGSFWSVNISPYVAPATYNNTLSAWRGTPTLIPEAQHLISTYLKGAIGPTDLRGGLRNYGIDLPVGWQTMTWAGMANPRQALWKRYLDSLQPPVPLDIAFRYRKLGDMNDAKWTETLQLHGFAIGDTREYLENPKQIPTPTDVLIGWQRGFVTNVGIDKYLDAHGFTADAEKRLLKNLSYQWPTPTDLIPFAVKDIWIQEIVDRFEYDAEFPQVFQIFMEKQGMGWKPSDLGVTVPPAQDITWPRAYWRSHWQVMSPTQAGHAVHFLRPDALDPNMSRRPGIPAFTEKDFDLILRTADYPPIIRKWLLGLSYTPLTRVDIRRMLKIEVIKREEAFDLYRDIGYDEVNAERLTKFAEEDIEFTKTSRARLRMETIVRNLFLHCVYSKNDTTRALYAVRRMTAAKRAAFLAKDEAGQLAEANADANIALEVSVLELQKKMMLTKRTISRVQSMARSGTITTPEVAEWLEQAGVQGDCVGPMVDHLLLEWQHRRKNVSVSNILTYVKRGVLSTQDAANQLSVMGYRANEIALMLQVASQDRAAQVAKEQRQLATTQKQQMQALARELKAIEQQKNEAIAVLNRSATKIQILAFLKRKLISVETARAALLNRGVLPIDAEAFIQQVLSGGSTSV